MHRDSNEENYQCQKHLIFDKNKANIFLHNLKNELVTLSSMENIENLFHNFSTTLLSSINKFSIEVSTKTSNNRTNPWYNQECKDATKGIKQATIDSIKMNKINHYKALIKIKKKKRHHPSKRQENILHLSKVAPKKFWRQILTRKIKDDNKIALRDWNSYLEKIYETSDIRDIIQTILTM